MQFKGKMIRIQFDKVIGNTFCFLPPLSFFAIVASLDCKHFLCIWRAFLSDGGKKWDLAAKHLMLLLVSTDLKAKTFPYP